MRVKDAARFRPHGRDANVASRHSMPQRSSFTTKALDDRCRELGLANGDPGREQLGRRVMHLFETGTLTVDDLKRALHKPLP
ncbi:hypothetical protein D3227_35940 [Mesorhizobium waimense]|uniref:Uncharacterized protein n=1 Tax=Mesorhizobium waimense TaxID=1300307 RepID=A0A3A5K5H1_9HYPH|nr:hypothetical protein D3227_35940 [Mesorhizobium waimense]